ncbi:MAG: hypothetical protein M0Z52_09330 [Actinomycetota bacterium]|nr:hypothetical protein [Actinomycetota bacterium]
MPSNSQNKPLKIAYILLIHKNPATVNALIRQLSNNSNADIYIHIDKKSCNSIASKIFRNEKTIVLNVNIDTRWGDISLVDATINLLRAAVNSGRQYDFVCLKSGQDLMIRDGFENFLAKNRDKIFMNAQRIEKNDKHSYFWKIKWPRYARKQHDSALNPFRILRLALVYLYRLGINVRPNPDVFPMHVHRGSQWFCIPGYVAEYIINFVDKNDWYYNSLKDALAPDEYFFQTIIMNSQYSVNNVCNNLTYIRFGEAGRNRNHPVILKMGDVPEIEKSEKFFARKFDPAVDNSVIDYFMAKFPANQDYPLCE